VTSSTEFKYHAAIQLYVTHTVKQLANINQSSRPTWI